jgi:hypothetical protein
MKQQPALVVTLAALFLATQAAAQGDDYWWTLSSSAADPYMNVGTPTGGVAILYLWLACSAVDGAAALEADVIGPAGAILGFSGPPGVAYIPGSGFVFPSCTSGPAILGQFLVLSLPGQFCFVPTTSSQILTYDCQPTPLPHATGYVGFGNLGGAPPCDTTVECPPLSVDPTPWGSVKGLYR